jgi:hypothetical protein
MRGGTTRFDPGVRTWDRTTSVTVFISFYAYTAKVRPRTLMQSILRLSNNVS